MLMEVSGWLLVFVAVRSPKRVCLRLSSGTYRRHFQRRKIPYC
jgi:hypothetical protein